MLRESITWARSHEYPVVILGGGSNVLVSADGVRGLVIQPHFKNISYEKRENETLVTVGAGVVLDELIAELVYRELWGLENLSAIPGSVGAVPVQNVGAYGVEAKDVIERVEVYDMVSDTLKIFSNAECAFEYRNSLFKREEGQRYVIVNVTFVVQEAPRPCIAYKDLLEYFGNEAHPTIHAIRTAVMEIRSKKLPDWHTIGTAGSFFKNPIVPKRVYEALRETYSGLPGFPEAHGNIKISLGWILDVVCHLRGYRMGNVGLYEKQALVLVCEEGATAYDVEMFAREVTERVYEKTGILIEQEVRTLA